MLNLDTHILVNGIAGSLTTSERQVLSSDAWGVADIVLWEIEMLYRRGRIGFGLDYPPLSACLRRVRVWPISLATCSKLRVLDFHSDPADEIIAATSLAHAVPLVTRDAKIRSSQLIDFLP